MSDGPRWEPRPANMAEAMEELKGWLDICDRMTEVIGKYLGRDISFSKDKTIQGDLLMWAEWFRAHPDVDAAMYAVSSLSAFSPD